ncbi:plasmid replication initiator TrfA [Candidatus Regiella endosymbiont of Tuberolachnus salignus]|uniref:plasmid replication initiator TrfA n=1 Tax=Candidatus Regiella endosymbiont of Tuberolachnus salignus TaxID=3077956 RepID=UPI0030CCF919
MLKNIQDLMKLGLENLEKKQADGLNDLEAHKAFIEASLAKEKRRNTPKNEMIESKTTGSLLPSCSNNVFILPNAILRCSLFGIVAKGKRCYEKKSLKAAVKGITVKFTGEQLDQADLDVWAECIHRCRGYELGEKIRFSSHSFLKAIRRSTGNSQHEWLKSCLLRLSACVLELGDGRFFYVGHLLQEWYRDEKTGEYIVVINPKIAVFFSVDMWTGILAEQRAKLKNKPLAKWLHAFYSTHDKPFEYKVETLMNLCGSEVFAVKTFKQKLKKSLVDLSDVTGWECSIDKNDLVQVKKN